MIRIFFCCTGGGQGDYRHCVVPSLSTVLKDAREVNCGRRFLFVGAFGDPCSPSCNRGALPSEGTAECNPGGPGRELVISRNRDAMDSADLVFAYIENANCLAAFEDLNHATVIRKPIVLVFAPGADPRALCFVKQLARVYVDITRNQLPETLRNVVLEWRTQK